MPGFSSVTGDQAIMFADNVSFDGTQRGGLVTTDGQLLIGSSVAPYLKPARLTSNAGTVIITNGHNSINLESTAASTITYQGNTGSASQAGGVLNIIGTGSLTTSASGNTVTSALTGLTNHALLVGAGTSTITNLGPSATSGQILQSQGASADPAFSTATYPSTTTINQILYSSSNNVVAGLSTTNRGVLTSNSTGVPALTSLATDGQLIIGSTAGSPAAATLTQGNGITITNASNSITVAQSGGNVTNSTLSVGTVYLSADVTNVTGDGTDYKVAFNSVFYDQNSDFNTTTNNLVIPKTGFYLLIGNCTFNAGLTSSYNSARMYISIPSHAVYVASNNPSQIVLSGGTTYAGSYIAQLTAGDLVNLHVIVSGST